MVVVLSMLRLMLFRMQKDFTFVLFAFFIIALAVTITRSEAVGVFAAVLLIGGAVEQVLLGLCSLALSPGAAEGLYAHMPIADMSVLQGGPLPWGSCIEGAIVFVCASALVALVMRRRKL